MEADAPSSDLERSQPMSDLPDSVTLKISRAEEHLASLTKKALPIEYGNCTISREPQADTGRVALVLRLPKMDPTISVIMGDCIHNLRCSLDHLISQLADHQTPDRADSICRNNQFPICRDVADWSAQVARQRLNGLCPEAVALVESFQPYHDGNDPLKILATLNNIDKHRNLNIGVALAEHVWATVTVPEGFHLDVYGAIGPFTDGDVLTTFDPREPSPEIANLQDLDIKGQGSIFIAFRDSPAEGKDIRLKLQNVTEFVRDKVASAFERFFR